MMVTRAVSSYKSSCLAHCRLLLVSIHCYLGFIRSKLVFVPVASVLTGAHRDLLFLAYFAQQPEMQGCVS